MELVPQPFYEDIVAATPQSDQALKGSSRPLQRQRARTPFQPRSRSLVQNPRYLSYAALDLGTNNCRLLIAQPSRRGFRVVDGFSRIVRLGEGISNSQKLGESAVRRTLEALHICRTKMEDAHVSRARLIATEACRLASNGLEFISRVKQEVGLELEIVDRETEANLAVRGCESLADQYAESVIIFDIGGGSTEIAWVSRNCENASNLATVKIWDSLPVGVVTLAERHGGTDVTPQSYQNMVAEVSHMLLPFAKKAAGAAKANGFHLLGTSGTVTTLGGIHLRLTRYDRKRVDGLWLNDLDVTKVINHLQNLTYNQRAANPCIGDERADLVLAGCAIFDAIRQAFPSPRIRIADRGLREGILLDLMREDNVWQGAR